MKHTFVIKRLQHILVSSQKTNRNILLTIFTLLFSSKIIYTFDSHLNFIFISSIICVCKKIDTNYFTCREIRKVWFFRTPASWFVNWILLVLHVFGTLHLQYSWYMKRKHKFLWSLIPFWRSTCRLKFENWSKLCGLTKLLWI